MDKQGFDMLPPDVGRIIRPGLAVMASFSTYISIEGIARDTGMALHLLSGQIKVFLMAGAMWTMFYVLWTLCLRVIPNAGRQQLRALLLMLATVVPIVLSVSTPYGASGFAGDAPQERHYQNEADKFDQVFGVRVSAPNRLAAALPVITAGANYYRNEAEKEIDEGHYTGVPGPGTVSSTLFAIETDLKAVATSIREVNGRAPKIGEAIAQHIANMRAIIDLDIPMKERERRLAGQANAVRGLMVKLDLRGTVSVIKQALGSLEKSAADQAVSSRSAELADAQRKALTQLAAEMRVTADKLNGFLEDIDVGDDAAVPVIDRISPVMAVIKYREEFWVVWAAAIGLDLTVLIVVFFLILAEIRQRELDQQPAKAGELRVDDLLRHSEALKALMDSGIALAPPKRGPGRPRKSDAKSE